MVGCRAHVPLNWTTFVSTEFSKFYFALFLTVDMYNKWWGINGFKSCGMGCPDFLMDKTSCFVLTRDLGCPKMSWSGCRDIGRMVVSRHMGWYSMLMSYGISHQDLNSWRHSLELGALSGGKGSSWMELKQIYLWGLSGCLYYIIILCWFVSMVSLVFFSDGMSQNGIEQYESMRDT